MHTKREKRIKSTGNHPEGKEHLMCKEEDKYALSFLHAAIITAVCELFV